MHRTLVLSEGAELDIDSVDFVRDVALPAKAAVGVDTVDMSFRAAKAFAIEAFGHATCCWPVETSRLQRSGRASNVAPLEGRSGRTVSTSVTVVRAAPSPDSSRSACMWIANPEPRRECLLELTGESNADG